MLVKGIMTQMSGSVGGWTGYGSRGGLCFRARAIPTDPMTQPQALMRSVMSYLSAYWLNTLSHSQREAWAVYANNVKLLGPLGDLRAVSGRNHFIRSNVMLKRAALPIVADAPEVFDIGELGVCVVTPGAGTGGMSMTFDNTDAWAGVTTGHLFIFQSRPFNPTVNYCRGPYQYVAKVDGAVTPPTSPKTWTSPWALAAGQAVFVRVAAAVGDGRYTAAQFLSGTVGP